MKKLLAAVFISTVFVLLVSCDKGDSNDTSSGPYFPEVRTIIQNNCLSCHNSAGTWEGRPVAFDNDSAIAQQYAAIKAAVVDPISPVNKRMPKDGMLSAHDIDIIVKWFDKGGNITD